MTTTVDTSGINPALTGLPFAKQILEQLDNAATDIAALQAGGTTTTAKGTDLTDSTGTIAIAQGQWRVLPAATLGANRSKTLSTAGATTGDWFVITRLDLTAYTLTIVDGGSGTPTLCVLPAGQKGFAVCQYNGTNWLLKLCGALPAPASTTVQGLMPAADKAFLDSVHSAKGTDLANEDKTLTVAGGNWYVMPAATLSANDRTITLGTSGAVAGDQIEVTRLDTVAHTLTFVNGGVGAGTLYVMANSKIGYAKFQFDGTNWALRSFGVQ